MITKKWIVSIGVALLLLLSVAPALAQDGGGGKVVIGERYVLAAGERLNGDLAVLGGSALIEDGAQVNGNVAVAGGSLTVDGTIMGDIAVFGGQVELNTTAVVEGDIATFGGNVSQAEGATVNGEVVEGFGDQPPFELPQIQIPATPQPPSVLRMLLNYVWQVLSAIGLALALAALGLLALVMFPKPVERVANTVIASPAATFGVGLLTMLIVFGLAAILAITICLAPISLLLLLAGAVAWLFAWIALGWLVGQRLLEAIKLRNANPLLEAILGIFLITLLWRAVPCLGWLFWFIISAWGLGAIVLTRFGMQPYNPRSGPGAPPPGAPLPSLALAPFDPSPAAAAPFEPASDLPDSFLTDLEDDLRAASAAAAPPAEPAIPAAPAAPAEPAEPAAPAAPAETAER